MHQDNWHFGAVEDEGAGEPRRAKLRAAMRLEPLRHSPHCPGLSGLFSIVNGIRLALAHKHIFSERQLADMVSAGLRFLDGRLTVERALTCGLPTGLWLRLAEALAYRTSRVTGFSLLVEREHVVVVSRPNVWLAIGRVIEARRPIIGLIRAGRYTVLSGFTQTSLLLFDSGGAHWISKTSTGVPTDREGAKHVLCPASFISLRS